MSYTNKSRIQNFLMINIDDTFQTQIDEWVSAIENWINEYCGREFEQESATEKLYDGDGTSELLVDDLITLTKIELLDEDGTVEYTIDATDEYYLYPANKVPKTRIVINGTNAPISIFLRGNQNVKITGTFGYAATVPEDVRLAATKLVSGIIQEKNLDIAGEIKNEKLGEYAVSFQDIKDMANHLGITEILNHYRKIEV